MFHLIILLLFDDSLVSIALFIALCWFSSPFSAATFIFSFAKMAISTRLFCWRPAAVSFEATGLQLAESYSGNSRAGNTLAFLALAAG
jgi:hypothetical protein